uniref:Uncharacterized protein n=1 Tax=Anguilla anguilla TaxID=7936 RepID=A0A0E9SFA6_ANGAN
MCFCASARTVCAPKYIFKMHTFLLLQFQCYRLIN